MIHVAKSSINNSKFYLPRYTNIVSKNNLKERKNIVSPVIVVDPVNENKFTRKYSSISIVDLGLSLHCTRMMIHTVFRFYNIPVFKIFHHNAIYFFDLRSLRWMDNSTIYTAVT